MHYIQVYLLLNHLLFYYASKSSTSSTFYSASLILLLLQRLQPLPHKPHPHGLSSQATDFPSNSATPTPRNPAPFHTVPVPQAYDHRVYMSRSNTDVRNPPVWQNGQHGPTESCGPTQDAYYDNSPVRDDRPYITHPERTPRDGHSDLRLVKASKSKSSHTDLLGLKETII